MEWQQLRGFHGAARLGSVSRAAENTLRTQSAVSQQIKALEQELGQPLFRRLGKKLAGLTPAGERLFSFCEEVLRGQEELLQDLEALQGPGTGRLSLAAPFTSLYQLLPPVISGFSRAFPRVRLKILDRPQEEVIALLLRGEVDFGVALRSRVPAGLRPYRWKTVRTMVMLPRGHALAGASRLDLRQVARYPLILPTAGGVRAHLEKRLAALGQSVQVVMESSNVELSALYVRQGLGLAFATVAQGDHAPASHGLCLLPLAGAARADHLALVVHRRLRPLPLHEAFRRHLLAS
ncbi:MAG: LysR family transcriptional regulator [Pseudomonadota bacterium]